MSIVCASLMQDAVLTAAWLRDLLRVGYQPPRINDTAHSMRRRVVNFVPKVLGVDKTCGKEVPIVG